MLKKALLGILLLTLVACGGSKQEDPADFICKTVVQFAVFDEERNAIDNLIEIFEADNPDLKIRLISLNDILDIPSGDISIGGETPEQRQQIAESADVFYDVFMGNGYLEKVALDLTPFIEADRDLDAADFYGNVLKISQVNGAIRTLPLTVGAESLFYDKKLFDKAGVAYPKPGWTWNDFITTAQALTIREGNEVTQWGYVDPFNNTSVYVAGLLGKDTINYDVDPPAPDLQSSEVREALLAYIDFRKTANFAPLLATNSRADEATLIDLIQAGKAAMWVNLTFNDNWSAAPLPLHSAETPNAQLWIGGLSMSAGTQVPDAAWKWMTFLSEQDPEQLAVGWESIPARKSVAEGVSYWGNLDEPTAAAKLFALENSFYVPDVYPSFLNDVARKVLYDNADIDSALASAKVEAEAEIDRQIAEVNKIEPFTVAGMGSDAAGVNPDAIEITFATEFEDVGRLRALSAEFTQQNPDIVVDFKGQSDGPALGFKALAATSDCFIASPSINSAENRSVILPVDALFENDTAFPKEDLYPLLRNQFTQEGQLWGVPGYLTPIIMLYNRDIFDANGVAYPQSDWTMDEFLDTAIQLTQGEGDTKQYGFVPNAEELFITMMWLERMGATIIDETADPITTRLTDPEFVAAARWYANLTTQSEVKPIFNNDLVSESDEAFGNREALVETGRAAMWTYAGNIFGDETNEEGELIHTQLGYEYGVVAIPVGADGAASTLLPAQGYFISKESPNRTQCWEWIKFITASPSVTNGMPSRVSVAESAEYRNQVGAPFADAYISAIDGEPGTNSIFRIAIGSDNWLAPSVGWFGRAMQQTYDGSHSIEEALAEAQANIDDYRTCVITKNGLTDPDIQAACLQEVDPSMDGLFN